MGARTPSPFSLPLASLGLSTQIPAAVLGATGAVGQRFLTLLERHPWFRVVALYASDRSAGKTYGEAANWIQAEPLPERLAGLAVGSAADAAAGRDPSIAECRIVFSALDAAVAGPIESELAERGHLVVTNTRCHRMDKDVPLLVPEVNPDHLELALQRVRAGKGAIVANPNCSTIGLVLALKPLQDAFRVRAVSVVTLQAISGAGLPGIPAYQIADNVIPFIAGEEEKLEHEPRKILGRLEGDGITPAELVVSAQCNRVDVVDGHTLCVSVKLARPAEPEELRAAWQGFRALPQELALPSAPERPVRYLGDDTPPQPRLHRDLDRGMAATVGRLRRCPLLDYRFVTLSHNTLRGAAGGAVLAAELAVAQGALPGVGLKAGFEEVR